MRVIRGKHVNVLVVCNELCVIGPLSLVGLIGHSGRPGIGEIAEPGPAALAGSVGAAHWPACLGGPEAGASRGWWCRDWWCRGARCAGRDRHTETATPRPPGVGAGTLSHYSDTPRHLWRKSRISGVILSYFVQESVWNLRHMSPQAIAW